MVPLPRFAGEDARGSLGLCRATLRIFLLVLAWLALLLATPAPAEAHSASSSYLRIEVRDASLAVQWSIALRDLDYAIGLDSNGDGAITWGELRRKRDAVSAYALARLTLSADGTPCTPGPVTLLADQLGDGGYAVLRFTADCGQLRARDLPARVTVRYGLMFDLDPMHRGLLSVVVGGVPHAQALSPERPEATFDVTPGWGETVRSFFTTGVDHLLTGVDHMLFVTMLLVPAMFRRRAHSHGPDAVMVPVSRFRGMFIESLKVLSAFTIAHGTTLTLSVLHIISIPERLSEAGIALTILVTALDNIFHFIPGRRWPLAGLFGLVHGLGFATALGPLALPPLALGIALVSFNLGLEAAQVAVAAAVLPIGFALRNTLLYPRLVMPGISGAVALIALAWFTDRALDLGMMPF